MKQEPVKPEEGRAMAERINAFAYVECSTNSMEGISEVIEVAARAALQVYSSRIHNLICSLMSNIFSHWTMTISNKTIADGGITVDFWIIKVHTSN